MAQNKTIELDCPACGGELEVKHYQADGSDHSVVECLQCHKQFGSWDDFKKEFITPMTGESQDRQRREGGKHHHHK